MCRGTNTLPFYLRNEDRYEEQNVKTNYNQLPVDDVPYGDWRIAAGRLVKLCIFFFYL
jgi:hypothetical protein